MKKTLLIMLGILVLFLPIVAAAEPDYTFKFGENAYFIASCDVNGVPCDPSTASCNMTLREPNGTYIVNYQPMTVNYGGDINYTVDNNLLTVIGELYNGKINCVQGSENKTATFTAMITPTGQNRTSSLFLILGLASLITLGLGMWLENEYVGFISGALFIVTGVYSMIYGIGNLADLYTRAIAFSSIGLGFIFEIAAGYKVVEGIIVNRAY